MKRINKNIVIAALARDCEKSLPNMIETLEKLREHFSWAEIVIVENDSKDNTKQILFEWEKKSKGIHVISQDFGTLTIPRKSNQINSPLTSVHRIEKMVMYRNIYMDYIDTIEKEIDYLMVIDIDIESFSIEGLIKSINEVNDDWGGLFSNGITKRKIAGFVSTIYYDFFAVFEYPYNIFSFNSKLLYNTFKSVNQNIKKNKFYSVVSAFGGIGIYKYNIVKGKRYLMMENPQIKGSSICEHIPFNTAIIDNGYKNYISKDFTVVYGTHELRQILKLYLPSFIFYNLNKLYKCLSK